MFNSNQADKFVGNEIAFLSPKHRNIPTTIPGLVLLQTTYFQPGASDTSPTMRPCVGAADGPPTTFIGDLALPDRKPLALFCSVQCPADLILKSYDLARTLLACTLLASPLTFIGGFQSPIEKEFLELLLRRPASQPGQTASASPSVIVCPARGLANMRIPRPWRQPLDAGRLLLLSTFPDSIRRATAATAATPASPPSPTVSSSSTPNRAAKPKPSAARPSLPAKPSTPSPPPTTTISSP